MKFSMPAVAHSRRLGRIPFHLMRILACANVLLSTLVYAINIPEGTSKLQYGTEIGKQYIHPLGLKGKSAAHAIQTLLGEGFRCDIEVIDPYALDKHPRSSCIKSPSGFGPLCDELLVTVRLELLPDITSRGDLYKRLDTIKVDFAVPLCPYPHEASSEYLAAHAKAEEVLQREVDAQQLVGNAKATYDKLMIQGYYCGFVFDQDGKGAGGSAKLVCTKLPSGIKYCFESKLVMDVQWPPHATTMKQLFDALPLAEVEAVRSSCVIPLIKGGSQPAS